MKLYYHPVSTTSRPLMLLTADENIPLDYELVDLLTGAHMQPGFSDINPCQQVPVLQDGDFRLTESSAILKYLADKVGSAAYPSELRERARVNEHGLVQHRLLPRTRLRGGLPPDLSALQT